MADNEEDRLLYLLSGTFEALPSSYIKLRSYLNIHSAKLAEQFNYKVFRGRNTLCPYCYTSWSSNTSTFKLLPSKKGKARKKITTDQDQKETEEEVRNTLVLKCKVCTMKSLFSLVKKKNIQKEETETTVKKKKKKKDKTCGLRVVLPKTDEPQPFKLKKKTNCRLQNTNTSLIKPLAGAQQKSSQKLASNQSSKQSKSEKKSAPTTKPNSQLLINPFAAKAQNKALKQKNKHLTKFKNAMKGNKAAPKKSLQDFLTLI